MKLIWATRGRTWGFRFLRDGGFSDPLPVYEEAFVGAEGRVEVCEHANTSVALRFLDPEGRQDEAGRTIPHDFVVFEPQAEDITSIDSGRELVWPLFHAEFDRIWNLPKPTAAG